MAVELEQFRAYIKARYGDIALNDLIHQVLYSIIIDDNIQSQFLWDYF